ncbi:sodium-dependent transporter [Campylobacter geochelonis]|uniref:Sodium-and chloride-dependent transporter, SNF family n=1 Tax=Campylobacter geochelonis TaxID=1780362 RepID=A0A128EH03_9BACT|nr:sodium-dependent transporter [Campylobacter geochelonis]QKF71441.1 sodium-dependent transporter, SNF family [Campylobacter geochelonis]CZE47841.1 sodium-and chloride-dependent transporter%2C SNF family [Campylobacter geochelonis]CZE48339.1 sodium-and chloride-dependent transporter%2C SNF family [Campylobacter geochelonis]
MRENFSKIGFILSVAGGAVGLGNAWKFPTLVGANGGFAFVLLYLVITVSIGFAIFLAEIAMGKLSQKDPVNAYKNLAIKHKNLWKFAGFSMIGGILVLSFYLVILGWVIRYIFVSFSTLPVGINEAKELFGQAVSSDIYGSIFYFFCAFFLTLFVVSKGVKSGIEKLNIYMMPALFIMLLAMLFYSFFFDGFSQAFKFLFYVDFSKLDLNSLLSALGLSFFTLCLGVGCILTYSASLNDDTNPVSSSFYIVLINILIGLMMGLIVFTFVFEFGSDPKEQGVGLVFFSLISLFAKLGVAGNILAFFFFLSLFFAGITSAVSMIEPFTFYLTNEYKISRKKALSYLGVVIFILGVLCILSLSGEFANVLTFGKKSFFDILDFVSSNVMLPIGAILSAIFVGFALPKERIEGFFMPYMKSKTMFELWYFMLRFVAPIAIVVIILNQILNS